MRRKHSVRGTCGVRLASRWEHCEYKGRVGNAMHGGGLHKRRVHCWHAFAAILSVMAVRRARHRIAALHRVLGRRRGGTVECIRRKSDCEHREKNWLRIAHPYKLSVLSV